MTDLRHRVERLEHAATSSTQSGATANDLANFPGMMNLVAGSGVSLTPGTGTLTIAASGGGSVPTGTGFTHITAGVQDAAAKTVDLASSDVTGDLPYANLVQATAASRILVRGSAGGAGDWQEGTLGTNLSFAGTVLNASGGQVDTIVAGDGIDVDSTDPVNPEVSAKISTDANNAVSFGSDDGLYVQDMGSFLEGRFGVSDYDDFVRGQSSSTPIRGGYTLTTNVGASSAVNNNFYDAGCAGHQGVIQTVTGTAASGVARLFGAALNTTDGMLHLGDGELEGIWWFRVDALSSGTLRYRMEFGFASRGDGTGASDSVSTFYQDNFNSGVLTLRSIVGGVTQTDAVGTTAIAANTWYRARIVINAAMNQADLYLKPYGSAEVHECTYTGSMPAASIGLGLLSSIVKFSGTGSATCCWDRWQYNYRFTNER